MGDRKLYWCVATFGWIYCGIVFLRYPLCCLLICLACIAGKHRSALRDTRLHIALAFVLCQFTSTRSSGWWNKDEKTQTHGLTSPTLIQHALIRVEWLGDEAEANKVASYDTYARLWSRRTNLPRHSELLYTFGKKNNHAWLGETLSLRTIPQQRAYSTLRSEWWGSGSPVKGLTLVRARRHSFRTIHL